MIERFDVTAWRDAFSDAVSVLASTAASVLLNLLLGIAILIVGGVLAYAAARVARYAVRLVGLDHAATRWAPAWAVEHLGAHVTPSDLLSRVLFWLVFLTFVLLSLETLGLTAITAVVERVRSYLPSLMSAVIVILVGLLLARFLATVVSSAASVGGVHRARRLRFFIQVLLGGLVFVVAVEQLGLSTEVFVAPLTALVATAGFAGGLAFALGARPIITHILAGHFLRESLPRDAFVEINGERGVVERVGSTDTLLRNDAKTWSVPNGRLLEEVVVR